MQQNQSLFVCPLSKFCRLALMEQFIYNKSGVSAKDCAYSIIYSIKITTDNSRKLFHFFKWNCLILRRVTECSNLGCYQHPTRRAPCAGFLFVRSILGQRKQFLYVIADDSPRCILIRLGRNKTMMNAGYGLNVNQRRGPPSHFNVPSVSCLGSPTERRICSGFLSARELLVRVLYAEICRDMVVLLAEARFFILLLHRRSHKRRSPFGSGMTHGVQAARAHAMIGMSHAAELRRTTAELATATALCGPTGSLHCVAFSFTELHLTLAAHCLIDLHSVLVYIVGKLICMVFHCPSNAVSQPRRVRCFSSTSLV